MRTTLIGTLIAANLALTAPQASADIFDDRQDLIRGAAGLAVLGILLNRLGDDDDRYVPYRYGNPGYVYQTPRTHVHPHPHPRYYRDVRPHKPRAHKQTRRVIVQKPTRKVIVKRPVTRVIRKPVKRVIVKRPTHRVIRHKHGNGRNAYWHQHKVKRHNHSHR